VDRSLGCCEAIDAWFINQSYHRTLSQQYPVLGAICHVQANFSWTRQQDKVTKGKTAVSGLWPNEDMMENIRLYLAFHLLPW
jgi:hypothetical protein